MAAASVLSAIFCSRPSRASQTDAGGPRSRSSLGGGRSSNMSSMQAVPEADAGPNAYLVKDVEEWMTDDEESFVFLLSRLEIQASTSSWQRATRVACALVAATYAPKWKALTATSCTGAAENREDADHEASRTGGAIGGRRSDSVPASIAMKRQHIKLDPRRRNMAEVHHAVFQGLGACANRHAVAATHGAMG